MTADEIRSMSDDDLLDIFLFEQLTLLQNKVDLEILREAVQNKCH